VQVNEKNGVWDIYVNLSRAPLNDLKVRQAFMHAVDRAALAEALSFGSGKPTVQLFAQSAPIYDPALDALYPFDQKKARALLAEAGHKDGIEITQLLLNTTEYKQLGEALQAMLAESGKRVKFDVVDASSSTCSGGRHTAAIF
jgi:ABC-type transport system substrate-binding protein